MPRLVYLEVSQKKLYYSYSLSDYILIDIISRMRESKRANSAGHYMMKAQRGLY